MSSKGNENKANFLGMSVGKAVHLLRKNIMFHLAKQIGMDTCFRCGEKIMAVEEFGIDHKTPWLYVDKTLFWDVSNIAFSHRACNKTDRPKWPKKHFPKEGESWCSTCRRSKPKGDFGASKHSGSGTKSICNLCRKAKDWGHGKRRFRTSKYLVNMSDEKEIVAFERLTSGESLRTVASAYGVNYETLRRRFMKKKGVSI